MGVTILKINFYGHSNDENLPWIIGLIHFLNASEKIFFIMCLDFKVFYKFVNNTYRSTSSNVLICNNHPSAHGRREDPTASK